MPKEKMTEEFRQRLAYPVEEMVRFLFTCDYTHTHKGLPFTSGDIITIPAHEADQIEAMGSGHRITEKE